VVFTVGGGVIAIRRNSPWEALVVPVGTIRTVIARVTFTDKTPRATLRMRFRSCAAATRPVTPLPPVGRNGFTG
jgi:hypothetical protein